MRSRDRMRRRWLLCLAVAWCGIAQAAWLDNVPITVVQPNGDTLHVFATGDEFYHYMHDADGYTILKNPETGYYVYADKVDDKLVATQLIVGRSNPTGTISQPRLTISNEEYRKRRLEMEGLDSYKSSLKRRSNTETDTINHIVIFISFADDPVITKDFDEVDYMFNATNPGARSVYNYFKTASYNQIRIPSTFYPSPNNNQIRCYVDLHNRDYYSPYNATTNPNGYVDVTDGLARRQELLLTAIDTINTYYPIPSDLNLDYDNDGCVDVITFAINSDVDGHSDLLWPVKSSFDENIETRINGKRPNLFTFELIKSYQFYLNTFCHELIHVFGAPDFYHLDKSSNNPDPLGAWDIMCYDHDDDFSGNKTSNPSAYIKWKYLNWIEEIPTITDAGTYTLQTLGIHGTQNAFKIASSVPNQYYVLEYRFNNEPFDENVYGTGLVIYRVNEDYEGNFNAYPAQGLYDELYIFRPDGTVTDNGHIEQAFFSLASGRVAFNQGTNPAPCLSDGTPDPSISIYVIMETGSSVSFTYGYKIQVFPFIEHEGTVAGGGPYAYNSPCTVTATPSIGYAFAGWYDNFFGGNLYSNQPEYTFTVKQDRTLVARFVQRNYTVTTNCQPSLGGTVTGNQGSYPAGSMVTLTATANSGYAFSGWMENGVIVCNNPVYSFQALANRHLAATFVSTEFAIGSLVTNPDGSQGVVFHLSQDGTEGWMVALNDASEGCSWGPATDIVSMKNVPNNDPTALNDLSGYLNTGLIRTAQGIDNEYAASFVDYENGWYLPSVGQLRKLYAALPFIESTITEAGGTLMTEGTYWSSTEFSASDASTPMFALGNTSKTSTCRVRAIRNFVAAGNNVVLVSSNNGNLGTATVSGNGTFAQGQTVTVTATPEDGCAFEYWCENGAAVSFDAVYQFGFTHTRALQAHFSVKGSIGSIVCNADGSKGVVFYLSPDGTEGLMAALEDASEGCQWGPTEKVYSLVSCPFNDPTALKDISGARNTRGIRHYQGTENEYAAALVDFANGWYLPSAGELRKLYASLPMIEMPLAIAGGCSLSEDTYWSSTEYSASDALTPSFNMGNTGKGATCRVRAIRSFAVAGPNCVTVKSNNENLGTAYVSGTGEFAEGQSVTVTASPAAGYVFDSWTEAGMTVSYSPVYQFNFTRSRALTANFVSSASVGSTVVNADGSKGVVFYTFPSGIGGLMVALEDDSEGCPWGLNEDITILDNQSPDAVIDLLNDMNGRNNTVRIRAWYEGNPNYAACKTDFANGWYLPSTGQLRKLYGALPMIENALINAGGTMLRDDAYWSSTEQSADNAWTPSFAMGSSNKTGNCRVRAIRSILGTEIIAANVNIVDAGTVVGDGEYDVGQTCTMTAIPAEGYTFVNWTDNRSLVSTLPTIQFVVDDSRTLTANFIPTDSISTQTIALSAGWNWFSTYLDITLDYLKVILVDALGNTNITINSQSDGNTTYVGSRWRGPLNTLDVNQMYLIKASTDCELTLIGTPINPTERPITIHNGFNWLAFPLPQSMTLTNAFAGFAVNGDMVVSQADGSSTYNNRWRGTLSTLEPGRGYMYKSTITVGDRVFTFPISTK